MMNAERSRALLGCALCAAVLLLAPSAAAADTDAEDAGGLGNHQQNIRVDLGFRTQFVKDADFDAFSERDALHQVSLGASWDFWAAGKLSLAGVAGFDYGKTSATLRSDDARLGVARFVLAPEVRYHLLRVLAVTAKLGPTLTREAATVSGSLDTELSRKAWRFGFDATAGVAVELAGYASGRSDKPRLWLTGEGGYGWTAPMRLVLKPSEAGAAPQRFTPLALGDLSLGGPLFRITAALSFW
jgi:hypothetical protein